MAKIRYFVRFSKVFLAIFVRFSNDAKGSFRFASLLCAKHFGAQFVNVVDDFLLLSF